MDPNLIPILTPTKPAPFSSLAATPPSIPTKKGVVNFMSAMAGSPPPVFKPRGLAADPDEELAPGEEALKAIGSGLKNQVLPHTVIFGEIALDLNELYYQNVLSIKRHNGNKIIGHKKKSF